MKGTEDVLDRILEAIERCGDEVVATVVVGVILGVVLTIAGVDGDDASG